jgi:hypothetical protein
MRLSTEGVEPRCVAFSDNLIKVGGTFDVGDNGLTVKHFPDMLKIRSRIESISQFLAEFLGMVSNTSVEIGEVWVEVIINFEFTGGLMEKHPTTTAEHLNVSVTGIAQP